MNKEEIIAKINKGLAEEFEKEEKEFKPEANLKEVLSLDSLDIVDLVVLIEENFGIKVQKEELSRLKTFADFYQYLDSRINPN